MKRTITLSLTALMAALSVSAAPPAKAHVFGAAQVQEVYRLVLDRDALLLESINDVIREKGIRDGHVAITAGSVQECTYHFVTTTDVKPRDQFKTVKEPSEILSGGGIIADGMPHIHIVLSAPDKAAFGGHLENNCRILYLGEVTITKYSGPALTRKPNQNGVSILTEK